MKISKLVAGAGLALSLAAFSPAVFAQNAGNYRGAENANSAAMNQQTPRQEAREIRNRISTDQQNGENVKAARHQYKIGMRDLNNGKKFLAHRHFERAENDLNMRENSGAASSTMPASGNWNHNPNSAGGGDMNR
jgi:hypothetical protein